MSWIRKIFGLKEKENHSPLPPVNDTPKVVAEQETLSELPQPTGDEEICKECQEPILEGQKCIHKFGNAHHLKCWRELLKLGHKELGI